MNPKSIPTIILTENELTGQLLKQLLEFAGYQARTSSDPERTLDAVKANPRTLVVIDEKLVASSWKVFVQRLKGINPVGVVVLLNQANHTSDWEQYFKANLDSLLSLPAKSGEILRVFEQAFDRIEKRSQAFSKPSVTAMRDSLERTDALEVFSAITRKVTSSLEIDDVLKAIVETAVNLSQAEEGSLLLYDEDSKELVRVAGKSFRDDVAKTFRQKVEDTTAGEVLRTGEPFLLDANAPKKFLTAFLVHSLIYVPLRLGKKVIGVLGVDNNVSKQTQFTEKDVKLLTMLADYAVIAIRNAHSYMEANQERNKLATILTRIQDGIIIMDEEKRLRLINPVAKKAFELSDSAIGKLYQKAINNPQLVKFMDINSGKASNWVEIETSNNTYFAVQFTPIPNVGTALTMHDITHDKKLDQMKSELVTTVSHDLRTPLTTILGYAELVDRVGEVNDQQREFIQKIKSSVKNITLLVNNLLDLGKVEADFDTNLEQISFQSIITASIEVISKLIRDKQLQVKTMLDVPTTQLKGNPIQLRQMMDNLIGNAVRYTPANGKVEISCHQEENQIIIKVSDTGVGIPTTELPNIFDRFYRASNVANIPGGTGLGLSIVKTIVENHHGRIWVDSLVGKGSAFTIVLPVES
jgi:two-component system NtrC family sensor kinase